MVTECAFVFAPLIGAMTDITDVNNVYLNVVFPGPDPSGPEHSTSGTIDITRTQAIIDKPSDFFISITRLTLPLSSEPLYIFPVVSIAQGNTPYDPYLSPFVIGITYNGLWYGASLLWQPEILAGYFLLNITIPTDYNPNLAFYWMFSYDTLCSIVNEAVGRAFALFAAANAGYLAGGQPWLSIDAASGILSWSFPGGGAGVTWSSPPNQSGDVPATPVPRLAQNIALQSILDGWRTLLTNTTQPLTPINNPAYANDILNMQEIYVATQNPHPPLAAYFSVEQTTADISSWNSVRRIIVTSNSLPTTPEIIPAPPLPLAPTVTNPPRPDGSRAIISSPGTQGGAASLPILADMILQTTNAGETRGVAFYEPTAQYKLVDMLSNAPLYRFDLTVSWVDTQGNVHPIQIPRNQQASLKIAFVRKPLYLHYRPLPQKALFASQAAADREDELRRYRKAAELAPSAARSAARGPPLVYGRQGYGL